MDEVLAELQIVGSGGRRSSQGPQATTRRRLRKTLQAAAKAMVGV